MSNLHRFTCEVYVVQESEGERKAVWVQCRCDEVAAAMIQQEWKP